MDIHGMGNIVLTSQNVPALFGSHFISELSLFELSFFVEVHILFTKTVDNIKALAYFPYY